MTDSTNPAPVPDDEATSPLDDAIADDTREAKRGRLGWLSLTVAALFGLFFAYDLYEAIENAIEIPRLYAQIEAVGLGAREVPWVLIWVGILVPPIAFGLAFVIGLRRNVFIKALLFLLGLVLVAALSMSINAIAVAA